MTVLLVLLLLAGVAELVTVTSTESIATARRHRTLAHELAVDSALLLFFVTNGRQGFNYRRGTWHMPLISFAAGQEYLIIDRGGSEANCEEHTLDDVIYLQAV